MELSPKVQKRIADLYKGKSHAELTIGILKDGEIRTMHLDPQMKEVEDRLIYPVGSIGKVFTASLLAKDISEGKIKLEDSIDQYIEGLPKRYYPTIKRMTTHHSGYGGIPFSTLETVWRLLQMNDEKGLLHVNPFRGTLDESKMMDILRTKKLEDKEYKFEYSNFAFGVLGYIAGKLEGTDFFTAMEAYFAELGLKETSLKNSMFTGYDKKGNACSPWQWEPSDIIAPAGAMVSSMEDLLTFAKINMSGELPYLELCHQVYASGEKQFDQGLGWRIRKDTSVLYHVGSAGAFSCILAMNKRTRKAAAIGLNYALEEIEDLAFQLLEE